RCGGVRARRLPPEPRTGRRARRAARGAGERPRRDLLLPPPRRRRNRAAPEACRRGEPRGRHAGGDRTPAPDLPRRDRADRRALPGDGEARADPRRAVGRGSLERGPGRAGASNRMIIRKSPREIELMAAAGAVVAGTLALIEERLEPGVSMAELDRMAEEYIRSQRGVPTSKGYKGFPAATCISPNDMIVHGIPGVYRAREGDLVSIDVGV